MASLICMLVEYVVRYRVLEGGYGCGCVCVGVCVCGWGGVRGVTVCM